MRQHVLDTVCEKSIRREPHFFRFLNQRKLQCAGIVAHGGFIVAEQAVDEEPLNISGFCTVRIKDYKRTTKMTFLRSAPTEEIQ